MARHQVVKVLCIIVMFLHCVQAAAIDDPIRSKSSAPKSSSNPGSVRQARAGGESRRRDYRCLNCPNTDERARFIDSSTQSYHPNRDYYRQAPLAGPSSPYAARDDRNSWYYPSDYTDLDQRYPYYVSEAEASRGPADYATGRYEDRGYGGGGSRYNGRYEDRYYVPAPKQSGYLPAHGPLPPVQSSRYEYGSDYRGNGYDNRDAEYQMRAGLDQYYREPDYDRYAYHRTPLAAPAGPPAAVDYGRDYGRDYPRDYVPPRSYPRDYVRDYPAREYGSYAYRGDYVGAGNGGGYGGGGGGGYGGGGYDDRASSTYGSGANRLGYDNRNFRPWDESYRGTSGFDNSGRGYYFASRLPYGSAPPSSSQRDTKPYRVSSHYYLPNSPSAPSASSSGSIAPSSTYSSSSASQAPSQSAHSSGTSPTSSDPHKPGGQTSDTSSGIASVGGGGGVSSYDQNQSHGLKATGGYGGGGGGGGGGGRYADRVDRPDKDALSARYGGGSAGASRYLRPLAGSYLFEREGGVELVPVATIGTVATDARRYGTGRTERLTMQPATTASATSATSSSSSSTPAATAAMSSGSTAATAAAATTLASKSSVATPPTAAQVTGSTSSVAADTRMYSPGDGDAAQLHADVTAAVDSDTVSASEVASLVAASTSTRSTSTTSTISQQHSEADGAIADERL